MNWDYVKVARRGRVAVVTYDRGARKNALSRQAMRELTEVALQFHDDDDVLAVVLEGRADGFSAGMDLKERAETDFDALDDLARRRILKAGGKLAAAWAGMPQLTICAIEKLAVGGGVALSVALDWRVLARDAFLYVPEVKVGINLQWNTIPRLVALVGPARAKRIAILAERLDARTCLDWGLVDALAEPGAALDAALEMAQEAAARPPLAARMIKEAVDACVSTQGFATSHADSDQCALAGDSAAGRAAALSTLKR